MMYRLSTILLVLCLFEPTLIIRLDAQNPGDPQNQRDVIVVNSTEVLFDVVVRDKQGRLVKNLSSADFDIYEDGVKQQINSFNFTSPSVTSLPAATQATINKQSDKKEALSNRQQDQGARPQLNRPVISPSTSDLSAVAIVFDRLSPEARPRATQAALNYLENVNSKELLGVFLTDLSVLTLQPLTSDHELVKAGIEKASLHSPSLYNSTNEEAQNKRQALSNGFEEYLNPSSKKEGLPPAKTAPSLTSGAMAELELAMLQRAEADQRAELGDGTARGLLHIASSLRALPGRKAVIFFSEGLILPTSVMSSFHAIINAANRNNVSFYAIDAAGLRTESKNAETSREINSRSQYRMGQLGTSADADGPMTKELERNEDLLRLNPDSGLAQLASQTGGFLISDSNDLKGRLRQVDEDLHSYYLMSYRSSSQNYDGHFRKIEVKVKRSGLNVQSRKGYFAIRDAFMTPVLSYEAPALAALDNQPKANSFPFAAGAFNFPTPNRPGLTQVIADFPSTSLTFKADKEKGTYESDFSVVGLIKDESGQVVQKVSHQYRLSGPIDKAEERKANRVSFYREADLPPGDYTLAMIAYDAPTGRASVRTGRIEIPSDENKLQLSDVVFLKAAGPASGDDHKDNPFRIANMIVSPNLGEPIQRTLKEAPFIITIYVVPGNGDKPTVTIELRQQGHMVAQMPAELPAADATGRIQYLASLPLEKLAAGTYELRIIVNDGANTVTRSRAFALAD